MKRIVALLLVLAMCFSLCACGKSEAVTNVEGLIDAIGEVTAESESVITAAEEAYNALTEEEKAEVENFAVLTAARVAVDEAIKTAEYEALKTKILGEWVVLGESSTITLNEDGSSTYKYDNQSLNGSFEITDKGIKITFELLFDEFELVYQDKNGIEYLTADGLDIELVKAEYATTTEYEINIDNWQDYFTIIEKVVIDKNGFGEVQNLRVYQGLELKDEYLNRLVGTSHEDEKYSIAVESKFTRIPVFYELNGEEISYEESTVWSPEDDTQIKDIRQSYIYWYYNVNNTSNDADIIAVAGGYGWGYGDEVGVDLVDDLEILRIQGTLLLYDLPLSDNLTKDTENIHFTNSQMMEAPPVAPPAP